MSHEEAHRFMVSLQPNPVTDFPKLALEPVQENEEADEFIDREVLNKPLPKKIEIWGKRWNSRASGYHRAHVYVDDKLVHVSDLNYGSSDQYVQTGMDYLVSNFYIPRPPRRYAGTVWLRELGVPYVLNATDVKRERDTL